METQLKRISGKWHPLTELVTSLKEARERRGLSLQDICDKTGITRASLSVLENGKGNPTMMTLQRVAEAIGVKILVTVKSSNVVDLP